jgi:hypothetical protein
MKNRGEIVFMDVNYFKLLKYQTSVGEQLIYDRKKDYYLIINNYLNRTLMLIEFRTQFLDMEKEDREKGYVILGNIQATVPDWRRRIVTWLTRRSDEIQIQAIISSCEAKIGQ